MGGVDHMDACIVAYSCARKRGNKFYKKIFFHLFDLAIWNVFVIYKKVLGNGMTHLDFRLDLIRTIHQKHLKLIILDVYIILQRKRDTTSP